MTLLFLFIAGVAILLVGLINMRRSNRAGPAPPPGPMALPILGTVANLVLMAIKCKSPREVFFKLCKDAKDRGGMVMHRVGELRLLMLEDRALIHDLVVLNGQKTAGRPQVGSFVRNKISLDSQSIPFSSRDKSLARLKTTLHAKWLTQERVYTYTHTFEQLSLRLVELLDKAAEIDDGKVGSFQWRVHLLATEASHRLMWGDEYFELSNAAVEMPFLCEHTTEGVRNLFALSPVDLVPKLMSKLPSSVQRWINAPTAFQTRRSANTAKEFALHRAALRHHQQRAGRSELAGEQKPMMADLVPLVDEFGEEAVLNAARDVAGSIAHPVAQYIAWSVRFLIEHPQFQHDIVEELRAIQQRKPGPDGSTPVLGAADVSEKAAPQLRALLLEILRLATGVPTGLPRTTTEAFTVQHGDGEVEVPEGTWVLPLYLALHYSEKYYEDAAEFRPSRWLDEHGRVQSKRFGMNFAPFGMGVRGCPGSQLAQDLLATVLANLILRFEVDAPAEGLQSTDSCYRYFTLEIPDLAFCVCPRDRGAPASRLHHSGRVEAAPLSVDTSLKPVIALARAPQTPSSLSGAAARAAGHGPEE